MPSRGMSSEPCEAVRLRLQAGGELSLEEISHAETCPACMDALLDSELDAALATKPLVKAPEGFAARLALRLPPRKPSRAWTRGLRTRHAGLASAVALLLALMAGVTLSDPHWLRANGSLDMALTLFLVAEVAAIALWLGLSPRTR